MRKTLAALVAVALVAGVSATADARGGRGGRFDGGGGARATWGKQGSATGGRGAQMGDVTREQKRLRDGTCTTDQQKTRLRLRDPSTHSTQVDAVE